MVDGIDKQVKLKKSRWLPIPTVSYDSHVTSIFWFSFLIHGVLRIPGLLNQESYMSPLVSGMLTSRPHHGLDRPVNVMGIEMVFGCECPYSVMLAFYKSQCIIQKSK